MSTTRMPGFNAESSMYDSNNYVPARLINSSVASGTIQLAAAIYVDGRFYCYGETDYFGNIRCYSYGDTSGSTEICGPCYQEGSREGFQFCRRFENGRLIARGWSEC